MPHVTLNGVSLYYEETGQGPPLLLISGLGANRRSFDSVVPALSARYRVITLDNRGVGRSELAPGPYSIEDMAADVAALIGHLESGPVAAVGWSLGGVVLQSLLIDHRHLLSKAVLLSTLPYYSKVQHLWLDAMLALRQSGLSAKAVTAMGRPWGFTPLSLSDHEREGRILDLLAMDLEPTSYEGFAAQAEAIRVFDRRNELATISTPTLVIVGAEDVLTPPSQSTDIAQRIPGSRLVVLPRGGHAMLVEYPAPTLAAIKVFLASRGPE